MSASSLRRIASALAIAMLTPLLVHAQVVVLDDGFESYSLGSLTGQGPWQNYVGVGDGGFIVSSPVLTGSRALNVRLDLDGTEPPGGEPSAYFHFPYMSQRGRVELDAMKQTDGQDYLDVFLLEGPALLTSTWHFGVVFSFLANLLRYYGPSYPFADFNVQTFWNAGQWYHLQIDWYPNSTAEVWIDGVFKGSGLAFHSAMSAGIDGLHLGTGANDVLHRENCWFDNVKVTLFDISPTAVAPSTWGRIKAIYR